MIVRCLFLISLLVVFIYGKPTKIDSNFMNHEDDIKTCGYDVSKMKLRRLQL